MRTIDLILEAINRDVHCVHHVEEDLEEIFGQEALERMTECIESIDAPSGFEMQIRLGLDDERNFKGSVYAHMRTNYRVAQEIVGNWRFCVYKRAVAINPIPEQGSGPALIWWAAKSKKYSFRKFKGLSPDPTKRFAW